VVWGADREQARRRLVRALDEFVLEGPHHNLAFHAWLALHPEFAAGNLSTRFVDEHWRPGAWQPSPEAANVALLAAALHERAERMRVQVASREDPAARSAWKWADQGTWRGRGRR
jgi:acetyl/propionyl-CoA carboxylase alpha subunit